MRNKEERKTMRFNQHLANGNILVIGCGGGFDAGSALPLWQGLKREGGELLRVFLGGVQEPPTTSFVDAKQISSALCWLTPETRLSPDGPDHPILTVRKCPELCIAHSLQMQLLYISADQEVEDILPEVLLFCKQHGIQTILAVDTGIDSHVTLACQGNLGDPELDRWTRSLLEHLSFHHLQCYLANICVGVETWISKDVQAVFQQAVDGPNFRGIWTPTAEHTTTFFQAWRDISRFLGFAPSNTGYVLHQAFSGVRQEVELPHGPGIVVHVNEAMTDYYIFAVEA
jgi:hypothetical protein